MKVLIIKTSSMGDIIHTLPALTDARRAMHAISFDWVVEQAFVEIPTWHPSVDQVIAIAYRSWRKKTPLTWFLRPQWRQCYRRLRARHYDAVIDAQGLIKSAMLTRLCRGPRVGFDKQSLREPLAHLAYQQSYHVTRNQHAITRTRQLFAKALHYSISQNFDYGLDYRQFAQDAKSERYVVFLHGTTWQTKKWPHFYWLALAKQLANSGYAIKIPWYSDQEKRLATYIVSQCQAAVVLPKMNLNSIASLLIKASAIVAVDNGLGHLAAALSVPTISLYGPTNPKYIGTWGANQIHLRAEKRCYNNCNKNYCAQMHNGPACLLTLTSDKVWDVLQTLLA